MHVVAATGLDVDRRLHYGSSAMWILGVGPQRWPFVVNLNKGTRHSNAPTPRVHQNMDIWCFWWTTRNWRLNLGSFLGWLVEGWHGTVSQFFALRVLLENAKNSSAAMVAHARCRVCQNGARG